MLHWRIMGDRAGHVGRGLLAWLFFPARFVSVVVPKLLASSWSGIGRLGLRMRQGIGAVAAAAWRLAGRMGLALRRLLAITVGRMLAWMWAAALALLRRLWLLAGRLGLALRSVLGLLIWRPLAWTGFRLKILLLPVWRFWGRLGLALRYLLDRFLWRPLLFVTTPLRWLYGRTLRRPVGFMVLSLRAFVEWLAAILVIRPIRRIREGVARTQAALQSQFRALRHDWRGFLCHGWRRLRRSSRAGDGSMASPTARRRQLLLQRLATVLATAALILVVGLVASESPTVGPERQPVAALPSAEPVATNTPVIRLAEPVPDRSSTTRRTAGNPWDENWPTPDALGSGGSLAFTWRQKGNSDLYLLAIGSAEPLRLTAHSAEDRDPAWSPDGRRLAFSSNRSGNWDLFILDLPGGELTRLTDNLGFDGGPSWSPDGQWLVYESYQAGNLDLFIRRADGSGAPIRLTEHPAQDFSPDWSPGGRHIAFTSWRSGNKDVFILSLDAASDEIAVNITDSPGRSEDHPAFAPLGDSLAYYEGSQNFELVFAQPLENYLAAGPPASIGRGRHPSWSPDGASLLFVTDDAGRGHLVAAALEAWGLAPQAFVAEGRLEDVAWSAVTIPDGLPYALPVDPVEDEEALFVENIAPQDSGPPYRLQNVGGLNAPAPYLSDRVDESFQALRQRVLLEAGWDFLGQVDNMFAPLDSGSLPGESDRSWSKAGRAFDFYYRFALADDPQVEVVREQRGHETYWRIYLRTAVQDGTQGEPLRELPWDFRARYGFDPQYYDQGGKLRELLPQGYYVDFTALAADYGWSPVPSLQNWRTYFQGIRYWHFENRQGTTWEEAMLELYSGVELAEAFGDS